LKSEKEAMDANTWVVAGLKAQGFDVSGRSWKDSPVC
jgi:hypothetical protein